jgi:hypothetical protein
MSSISEERIKADPDTWEIIAEKEPESESLTWLTDNKQKFGLAGVLIGAGVGSSTFLFSALAFIWGLLSMGYFLPYVPNLDSSFLFGLAVAIISAIGMTFSWLIVSDLGDKIQTYNQPDPDNSTY